MIFLQRGPKFKVTPLLVTVYRRVKGLRRSIITVVIYI